MTMSWKVYVSGVREQCNDNNDEMKEGEGGGGKGVREWYWTSSATTY